MSDEQIEEISRFLTDMSTHETALFVGWFSAEILLAQDDTLAQAVERFRMFKRNHLTGRGAKSE